MAQLEQSKPLRRDGRAKLRLPCRVQSPEMDLSAMITDLSYGGAGIVMPPGAFFMFANEIKRLVIEDIGVFDVAFRWRSSTRMGVSFNAKERARTRITAYFEANGIDPGN